MTQASPIWMWDAANQTFETSAPATMCLVGERYQPEDLGFGPMDWRHLYLPPVPDICLSVLSPMRLLASGDLTVATLLYHMLFEVS